MCQAPWTDANWALHTQWQRTCCLCSKTFPFSRGLRKTHEQMSQRHCSQGHITTFVGPNTFAFIGHFLHKNISNSFYSIKLPLELTEYLKCAYFREPTMGMQESCFPCVLELSPVAEHGPTEWEAVTFPPCPPCPLQWLKRFEPLGPWHCPQACGLKLQSVPPWVVSLPTM